VIGDTDILSEGTFGPRVEQEVRALRVIRRNAFELLELITTILDLSRLEAGRLPLEMKELPLPALLEEVKAETQGVWEQSSLTFVWNVADKLPLLRTDPGKLKMAIKHLLGNAVKVTEQGSIVVEAGSDIQVRLARKRNSVTYEIIEVLCDVLPAEHYQDSTTWRHTVSKTG
jgi:signal transduction histidine kinase